MGKCSACNGRGDNNGDPYDFESCAPCGGTGEDDGAHPEWCGQEIARFEGVAPDEPILLTRSRMNPDAVLAFCKRPGRSHA